MKEGFIKGCSVFQFVLFQRKQNEGLNNFQFSFIMWIYFLPGTKVGINNNERQQKPSVLASLPAHNFPIGTSFVSVIAVLLLLLQFKALNSSLTALFV